MRSRVLARQLTAGRVGRRARDRNVRVLGDEERLEAAFLDHAREIVRPNALVSEEDRDAEVDQSWLVSESSASIGGRTGSVERCEESLDRVALPPAQTLRQSQDATGETTLAWRLVGLQVRCNVFRLVECCDNRARNLALNLADRSGGFEPMQEGRGPGRLRRVTTLDPCFHVGADIGRCHV